MKILFLVYHGFSEVSGISKKIHYQVKGLRENGHEVYLCYYDFANDDSRCRFVNGLIIKNYGKGRIAALRQRLDYDCIYDFCIEKGIEFVYARCYQNANPMLVHFFKRLRKAGIHCVTEIPTFPYDDEFYHFEWKYKIGLKMDQMFRNQLYKYMDALVTFSDAEKIFGQRTIRISNGVDFDSIPLHQFTNHLFLEKEEKNLPLHLIGVAEVHDWHGFDRVMTGIGEYKGNRDVFFHVVGGVHPYRMKNVFLPIIEKYKLQDKIIFHNQLFGDALTKVFNQCQFAIGSLGRHRSGITVIKTLKNREYATRGIPFIYSEQDSDFDNKPYVLKAPAEDTPLNIQQIIDFINQFTMKPEDIRKTVEYLKWKIQMQLVVDTVFDATNKATI
ncbi:MAG: glycosyltransferase family 1 protein [Bacteroidaceae bacterium]|nr:glycosyltransferase family 1 protein [Bacteroidaceae bacterium]